MKKRRMASLMCAIWSLGPAAGWAATSGPISVMAEVESVESLDCSMVRFESGVDQGAVSEMDFGDLDRPTNPDGSPAAQRSLRHFQVFCGMNTSGRPFTVTQTGGTLTSGSDTLQDGAWIFTPLNGVGGDTSQPLPSGSTVGTQGSAASTDKLWYQSDAAGTGTTISSTYGITNDAANGATEFVPPDQPAGSYSTAVTWTLTVNP